VSAPAPAGHLSIGEVLSSLQDEFPDVTVSKIRFLESQGLIDPERTPSGYRRFYAPDVERLRWILFQQREYFLPLRVIKERLDRYGRTGAPPLRSSNGERADPSDAPEPPPPPPPSPPPVAAPPAPRVAPDLTLPLEELADPDDDRAVLGPAPALDPAGERTRAEVCAELRISGDALEELEAYGMLQPVQGSGETARYDDEAFETARAAAPFYARAATARHLRMYQHFAEREAELFARVLFQYRRQRNPAARAHLESELQELARAATRLRALMLRRATRDAFQE
jgi:DNA-binding transcriptional MerR regulator